MDVSSGVSVLPAVTKGVVVPPPRREQIGVDSVSRQTRDDLKRNIKAVMNVTAKAMPRRRHRAAEVVLPRGSVGNMMAATKANASTQKAHVDHELSIFELIELELLAERTVKEDAGKFAEIASEKDSDAVKALTTGTSTSIRLPRVHVLLSPGVCTAPRPMLPPARGFPFTVCVMGLHRSGTHAMVQYLQDFFDVDVEPKMIKRHKSSAVDSGTICLPYDFRIWKHTVPLGSFDMPGIGSKGGPTIVLLMVRDVASWMESLSQHAYEIFPCCRDGRKQKRTKGAVWWMFEGVEMRTQRDDGFHDPFQGARFDSITELWAAYVQGYLSGSVRHSEGIGPTFAIVRFEDLVLRPKDVIEELHRLGLPRNATQFAPIENSVQGSKGREGGRSELVQRITDDICHPSGPEDRARLRSQMASHKDLLDLLGYTVS